MERFFQSLKKILFPVLGQKAYLKLLRKGFFLLYNAGLLRKNKSYEYHYFVRHLIRNDFQIVDLGANLGYYAGIFANLTKGKGKLICIEPVPPFYEILQSSLKKFRHCKTYNVALGLENRTIKMVIPKGYGYMRVGLANVASESASDENMYRFDAQMVIGSELLKDLPRLDYLKCDIEGYEEIVLPELKEILQKHRPIIQVEIGVSHLQPMITYLHSIQYERYRLKNGKLQKNLPIEPDHVEYIFLPAEKEQSIINSLEWKGLA